MAAAGPTEFKGFQLAPFQRRAAAALDTGSNVLVAAPTGAGKTLVAEYAIHLALMKGRRALYTAPIKALSNQKFRDFRDDPAIGDAGLMTGDITLQPASQVLVMTTEILRNTLTEDPQKLADVGVVVFDEVHYMDDPERGSVWEETLLFLPQEVVIVALSATIANLGQFAAWLERVRDRKIVVVEETKRPVPLKHLLYHPKAGIFPPSRLKQVRARFVKASKDRSMKKRDDGPLLDALIEDGDLPALYFCFSRRLCERKALKAAGWFDLLKPEETKRVKTLWEEAKVEFGFDDSRGTMGELKNMTLRGVAAHHAGMLPLHKEMVERLFTRGLLKLLFTTETFALGINMPARAVVFDSLTKFDGVDFDYMRTRDYLQMAGRAGRLGMDESGLVYSVLEYEDVVEAPIHRIQSGQVEPVISRFDLDYATLVHLHGLAGNEGAAQAWERSFAAFQAREHSKQREEQNRRRMRGLIERRYRFLDAMGYVAGDREVKARGRTCLHLYGYEIQLTELLYEGVFEDADPPSLCGLIAAVIHESRRREEFWRNALRPMRGLLRRAKEAVDYAIDAERSAGLEASLKPIDEAMAPAIFEYANGREFEELARFTNAAPGDFVRVARMTVQYLRHLRKVAQLGGQEGLVGRLTEAVDCIYRGPVDVRAELRLGADDLPE
ncbi:MAG: DEAD/DEAH box helicase [Planctomycetes bacterium]|nr:DEAD/DEAH box helicase [Planctomycetota bacterium]MBL7007705.1 DEAD/DEAH box helicase [Planctomycetota bacterium]